MDGFGNDYRTQSKKLNPTFSERQFTKNATVDSGHHWYSLMKEERKEEINEERRDKEGRKEEGGEKEKRERETPAYNIHNITLRRLGLENHISTEI